MVRPKEQPERLGKKLLEERLQEIRKRTIAYRWYVVEHTPAGENEIGGYVPPYTRRVSPHFDLHEDAQAWYDAHEADPGKQLLIYRDRLVITQTWMRG